MLLELEDLDMEPVPIWVFKDKNSSALTRYEYISPEAGLVLPGGQGHLSWT